MRLSDLSLAFLAELREPFSEDDVEAVWRDRVFPFVRTDDFRENWAGVPDRDGLFVGPSGTRWRVDAQRHHAARCRVMIGNNFEAVSYETIVFAKLAYRLSTTLELRTDGGGGNKPWEHPTVRRRRFVDGVLRKLPRRWRDQIVQGDLHLYDELKQQQPQSTSPRVHLPLADPKHIRLLTLLPALESYAPIRCTLSRGELPSEVRYEALSYVWGKGVLGSVQINGVDFPVTENLEAALRQLRPRGKDPRVLWVDAVCIDQSNVQERTEQVAQMGSVYRDAQGVVVWLGRESNTSATVFEFLGGTGDSELTRPDNTPSPGQPSPGQLSPPPSPGTADGLCGTVPPQDTGSVSELLAGTPLADFDAEQSTTNGATLLPGSREDVQALNDWLLHVFEGLIKLLGRPWWRRVWVLQEVTLARKVTIQCGPGSVGWLRFHAVILGLCKVFPYSPISDRGTRLRIPLLYEALFNARTPIMVTFGLVRGAYTVEEHARSLSMASLLATTHTFEATDPRDRLFALVGLLPVRSPARAHFRPDYMANTKQVFVRTAKYFLQETGSLDVFAARPAARLDFETTPLARTETDASVSTLPSWVPDWGLRHNWMFGSMWINAFSPVTSMETHRAVIAVTGPTDDLSFHAYHVPADRVRRRYQTFNCGLHQSSPYPLEFSASDEVLHVRGITVDTVSEVGVPWDLNVMTPDNIKNLAVRGSLYRFRAPLMSQWKRIARLDDDGPYPFTNQPRDEAFWRTLFLDRYFDPQKPGREAFLRLPRDFCGGQQQPESIFNRAWRPVSSFPPGNMDEEGSMMFHIDNVSDDHWGCFINPHCVNLSLFRSTKGYIGICHPNTRPGDKVAILLGAPVPFTLREYPQGHVLIGQSYVHGIMDGEIVRDRMAAGKGKHKEDYELFNII